MTKTIILVLGIVITLIGLVGFVNNPILGLFPVNTLSNIVHLLAGLITIVFAMMSMSAMKLFAKIAGIVYLLVAILGFVLPALMASLFMIDMKDNILHLVLAAVFIWLGYRKESMMMGTPTMG